MRLKPFLFAVLPLALAVASASFAETIVLTPDLAADMTGETDGGLDARVVMAFDLDVIPKDALIEYAGLTLYDETGVPWEAAFVPVVVGALARDWDASDASWEDLGADLDPRFTAYRVLVSKARTPAKFDLTRLVESWVGGEIPNYGIIAMIEEVADLQDVVRHFNAETLKPSLKIRYFLPSEDTP